MAKFKQRTLSLAMALVMAAGLLPAGAQAASGSDPLQPTGKSYENGALILNKTAQRTGADEWRVTLTVGNKVAIEQKPLEVVFVLDTSGSMAWCTNANAAVHAHGPACYLTCTKDEHTHESSCYTACTEVEALDSDGALREGYISQAVYTYQKKTLTCTEHHKHTDECISWIDCTQAEATIGHGEVKHGYRKTLDSYQYFEVTCGKELHRHDNSCYAQEPTCGLTEHKHDGGIPCVGVDTAHPSRLDSAISAIGEMEENFPASTTVRYVRFSSAYGGYTTDASVLTDLTGLKAEGSTKLSAGVAMGIAQFSASTATRKVLIVVADGASNDGYPTAAADTFKAAGGAIYTVGFMNDDDSFSALSSGQGYYFKANDTENLDLAMEAIAADIAAMIVDPMGSGFSADVNTVSVTIGGTASTGTDASGSVIKWAPGDGETPIAANSTITLTYTVKLAPAALTVGAHTGMDLNENAVLEYKLSSDGVGKTAQFPLPKASYGVGSLQVKCQSNGVEIRDPSNLETIITDWTGAAFATDTAPAQIIPAGGNSYYKYVDTTITKNGDSADAVAVTADAYVVTHNYERVVMYSVSYEYTNAKPDDANAAPGPQLYESGTSVPWKDEPTSATYHFSGWTVKSGTAGTDPFDITGDVVFQGTWTPKPNPTVTYFVDGVQKHQDSVIYGTDATLWNGYEAPVGKNFSGWDKTAADLENVTADLEVRGTTADKTFKVTYFVDGTQVHQTTDVIYGTDAALWNSYEAPVGKNFSGWDKTAADLENVTADLEVRGTTSFIDYNITYEDEDGTVLQGPDTIHYGDDVPPFATSNPAPTKAPAGGYVYTFHRWDLTDGALVDGKVGTTDLLYTAQYNGVLQGQYSVIYTDGQPGGAAHAPITRYTYETYTPLADNTATGFTRTGHSFAGWTLRAGSEVLGSGDALYGASGATIYYDAAWTANDCAFTVVYFNGYTNTTILTTDAMTVPFGTVLNESIVADKLGSADWINAHRPAGYNSGAPVYPTVGANPEGNVVVVTYTYTPAPPVVVTYTVRFVDYDGRVISVRYDYRWGDTPSIPADPARPADAVYTYTFAGWDRDPVGPVTGNAVYTATYTQTPIEIIEEPEPPVTDPPQPPEEPEPPIEEPPEVPEEPVSENVPLAEVPQTGDHLIALVLAAALSGLTLLGMALGGKRRRDAE